MSHRREQGFILPLAILLVVILAISGTSFMHHDYLERRMASNNSDNHAAFYLANAGLERARATLKPAIDPDGNPFWTPLLNEDDTEDGSYVLVDPPDLLCDGHSPCFRPPVPFGPVVVAPSSTPLAFDRGQYAVRVFNNVEEASPTEDTDGILTVRTEGIVGGERKLLRANVRARSEWVMVNGDEDHPNPSTGECPTSAIATDLNQHLLGKQPACFASDDFPQFQPNLYSDWTWFLSSWGFGAPGHHVEITAPAGVTVEFKSGPAPPPHGQPPNTYYLDDNTHYLVHGDAKLNGEEDNIVMFVTGTLSIQSFVSTGGGGDRGSILIGQGGIVLGIPGQPGSGTLILDAPLPYPALISQAGITAANNPLGGSRIIKGNIWSSGATGLNLNATNLDGIIFGKDGPINLSATTITDHDPDEPGIDYYVPMPGFLNNADPSVPTIVPGSWRELQ